MKVALNVLAAYPGAAGIGRYAANVAESLISYGDAELVLLVREGSNLLHRRLPARVTAVACRPTGPLWEQFQLPGILERHAVDIYHSPLFTAPCVRICSQLVTVHDVIPDRFPGQTPPEFLELWRRYLPPSLRASDAVLTVSEFSARDLRNNLDLAGRPVYVAYQALAQQFNLDNARKTTNRVRRRLQLPNRYILYVGSIEPRKNVLALVDAFAELGAERDVCLVLAGRKLFDDCDPAARAANRGVSDRVLYLGYVEDQELPGLYGAAEMLVFPSLYEGFGLPVAEALACGCPVVSADNSSLPEAGGDAAVYVNADGPAALRDAMAMLLEGGHERQRRIELGLRHVQKFTQEKFARRLMEAYGRVLEGLRP